MPGASVVTMAASLLPGVRANAPTVAIVVASVDFQSSFEPINVLTLLILLYSAREGSDSTPVRPNVVVRPGPTARRRTVLLGPGPMMKPVIMILPPVPTGARVASWERRGVSARSNGTLSPAEKINGRRRRGRGVENMRRRGWRKNQSGEVRRDGCPRSKWGGEN